MHFYWFSHLIGLFSVTWLFLIYRTHSFLNLFHVFLQRRASVQNIKLYHPFPPLSMGWLAAPHSSFLYSSHSCASSLLNPRSLMSLSTTDSMLSSDFLSLSNPPRHTFLHLILHLTSQLTYMYTLKVHIIQMHYRVYDQKDLQKKNETTSWCLKHSRVPQESV